MSRSRASRLFLSPLLLALAFSGTSCVFDPKPVEQPCTTNCPTTGPAKSAPELIGKLHDAYLNRNLAEFTNLLPTDDQAHYLFVLNEPLPDGSTSWGRTEELRIQRRMFNPESTPPGETPVPTDLWLTDVSITLTPEADFVEREDLYTENGGELDRAHWKASEANYHAVVFFDTQSTTDYRVDGRANYIVIEDLTKATGDDRKFLLYRWEDLGSTLKPAEPVAAPAPAI